MQDYKSSKGAKTAKLEDFSGSFLGRKWDSLEEGQKIQALIPACLREWKGPSVKVVDRPRFCGPWHLGEGVFPGETDPHPVNLTE